MYAEFVVSDEVRRRMNIEMAVALLEVQHRKGMIKNKTMVTVHRYVKVIVQSAEF